MRKYGNQFLLFYSMPNPIQKLPCICEGGRAPACSAGTFIGKMIKIRLIFYNPEKIGIP